MISDRPIVFLGSASTDHNIMQLQPSQSRFLVPPPMCSQWIFSDGPAAAIMPRHGKHAHLRQPAHHLLSGGWSSLDGRQFQQGSAILWCLHRCPWLFSSLDTPSTTQGCRRWVASSQPDFAGHMAKSVTLMARACLFCQWDNVHRHVQLHPATIQVSHPPFRPQTCQPSWPAPRPHCC
jgi:hypothetical protein